MGTRASGYPLSNVYLGSKISARVGTVGPPVVINTSRLAKISPAMKSCTYHVVVALLSATEASHLSGRQGADEVGRARWVCGLAALVTLLPTVLLQRQDAIAIVQRTCLYHGRLESRRPCLYPYSQWWLLNFAWHRWLLKFFSVTTGMSAAARVAAHLLCSPWLACLHRRSNSQAYAAWLSSDWLTGFDCM